MRGVDTSIFQFDFDLTWCAFFLNADATIYGRYGSRKDSGDSQFTVGGLKTAMTRALAVHKGYPANRNALLPKNGKDYSWKLPELSPSLAQQFRTPQDFPKACIHCHHVWRGVRRSMWMDKKPTPESLLYVYPMPETIGMTIDVEDGVTVKTVEAGTAAAKGGVLAGDVIEAVNGQPILSVADIQWILQNSPDVATLKVEVTRGSEKKSLTLSLSGPWRRKAEFDWRTSTGDLRLGMVMIPMSDDERKQAGLKAGGLKVKSAYQKGPATAAGFLKDDLLIAVNGQPMGATESEFLASIRTKFMPGTKLKFAVVRGGRRQEIDISLP